MERGVPIRSISRCIDVLQAINRYGALTLMSVARIAKLPYPTACRIIQTLMHEGMIECEPTRKCYRATALVHTLSRGFENHDELVARARPHIVALTCKVGWPLVLATRVGHSMMIRDTTHDLTSLTFNLYPPGYTMPLLECAAGQVYLAHLPRDERLSVIEGIERPGHPSPQVPLCRSDRTMDGIRENGYATFERNPHNPSSDETSSISVPIHDDGHTIGTLTLAFFASSMPMSDALERYLADMKSAAACITASMVEVPQPVSESAGRPSMPRGSRASRKTAPTPAAVAMG